jgi:hypothetical protein
MMNGDGKHPDRLYSTAKVGELLGGIHPEQVRRLIRDGKLNAVSMPIRGRNIKPRKYVPQSEIQRFIADLRETLVKKLERIERRVSRGRTPGPVTRYYK